MGRKKSRDSYTSKGERRNVSKKWTKMLRLEKKKVIVGSINLMHTSKVRMSC